ncbi:ABC transporter ATP-binding protein [Labedaea rhizosphaerae]|uniref:ATP-binding cassette subfamily C protein n=1 Tax=Labedaea rhizosphaerae TaxID=598644 RepID=A0A4R6RXN9_LABRH|nr:ABC transporter ATP-binding protein [Labedaea rhizosphaerae]TDP91115.1 ATP-binding cassette subfamily C protein [Labedaea rhizosphaerae]
MRLPEADRAAVRAASMRLVREDRGAALVVLLLYGLAAAAGLGLPWLVGVLVNRVESGAGVSAVDRLVPAMAGFAVAQLILERSARYAGHRFGERALARLRERFVDRVLALPTAVVEHAGTGDLMTRTTNDVATVGVAMRDAIPEILISSVRALLVAGAAVLLDPVLGLCVLSGTPLIVLTGRWYLRRARTAYLAEGAASSELSEGLAATATGARTVSALRLGEQRVAIGDQAAVTGYHTRVRTLWLRTVLFTMTDVGRYLPVAVTLVVGGLRYHADAIPLGVVVTAALYANQLADPLDTVLERMERLQTAGAAMSRLTGVHGLPLPPAPDPRVPESDVLEVRAARFAYRPGHNVLSDVDLTVRPGERLAVVGPSGAGKTTLARLLAGIDAPDSGQVTVGGVPVATLPAEELRSRIVLVTQEHHVFLGTLRDNLAIAAPGPDDRHGDRHDDDAFRKALATVDAVWVAELPDGLDTVLGAGGIALDAAQEQQLALARVVLLDPHTVILDEATALLDPATARHAERALGAALHGRTVIAIAHRLRTARDADRIVVMRDGRITEVGTHPELVAANGAYAELWRAQTGTA